MASSETEVARAYLKESQSSKQNPSPGSQEKGLQGEYLAQMAEFLSILLTLLSSHPSTTGFLYLWSHGTFGIPHPGSWHG